MLIEINRRVLEQLVKDKEYMYTVIVNWAAETNEHYLWWGVSLDDIRKHITIRPRGSTQISIVYEDYDADYLTDLRHIEKRIVKYKGKR